MNGARPGVDHTADNVSKLASAADWLFRPLRDDRAGNKAREILFSERRDNLGEVAGGSICNDVRGARTVAIHTHVERTVLAEREPAFCFVQLHRRNADIQQDAVDGVVAELSRDI